MTRSAAVAELENRAVLVALAGEYVGATPLLSLLRVALDKYEAACIERTSEGTVWDGRLVLTSEHELWGQRVYDQKLREHMHVVRGALSLYRVLRHDPGEALRVLRLIERATEKP